MFSHLVPVKVRCNNVINYEVFPQKGEVWAIYKDWDSSESETSACSLLKYEVVEILCSYTPHHGVSVVRMQRLQGYRSIFCRCSSNAVEVISAIEEIFRFSHMIPALLLDADTNTRSGFFIPIGSFVLDLVALPLNVSENREPASTKIREDVRTHSVLNNHPKEKNEGFFKSGLLAPEIFHSNAYNSNKGFIINQVWALNNNFDRMPRSYARINSVIQKGQEIDLEVSMLEPHPTSEEEMLWLKYKLPMTSGTFKAIKTTSVINSSVFSHHVIPCEESERKPFYKIYPKKGEIWAVFKNWCASWKLFDIGCCEYQMVEIISDFVDTEGLVVLCLTKTDDSTSIYRRHEQQGFNLIKQYAETDLLRFSHRVHSVRKILGEVTDGSPCWELDSTVIPSNFVGL